MKKKRIFSAILTVVLFFVMSFSSGFLAANSEHACEDEETCAICATIRECGELYRALSTAVKSSENIVAPVVKSVVAGESKRRALSSRRTTPVLLKVKLIN